MTIENRSACFDKQIYYRLIALWAVCEAFLGGMLHGLKLPVSGLLVGSCAVTCICLIAFYVPVKGAILKATLIVAVCKMMLSPHSPPPAYIAVFFQGLVAEILFFNKKHYRVACLLLGGLTLFESAIQRILVMTVLYGKNLWTVIDEFISHLTRQQVVTNYTLWLASGYILLHIFIGILVGFYAGKIVVHSQQWGLLHKDFIITPLAEDMNRLPAFKHGVRRKKMKGALFMVWLILIAIYLQSWLHIGKPILPPQIIMQLLLRSVTIVLSWYFLVSPLVMLLLKKWLTKQQQKSPLEIQEVLHLLPSTQYIIEQSWLLSNNHKGIERLARCCKIVLMNTLQKPYDR